MKGSRHGLSEQLPFEGHVSGFFVKESSVHSIPNRGS